MPRLMPESLRDAERKIVDAEMRSADLRDILMVLRMAISFETGGLDAEERSGIETVIGHAVHVAADAHTLVSAAGSELSRFAETMP